MTPAATRPNIVIIHWHDLGTHLPVYGYDVSTPHADSLSAESVVFTRCFSTSPLCSPARGALWTGRYPHSNGLEGLTHRGWEYRQDERTLAMHLGAAGYTTALVGLQHEARDSETLGFDELVPCGRNNARDVADAASAWLGRDREDAPFLLVCGMVEVHRDWPADRYPPQSHESVRTPDYLPDNDSTREDLAAFGGAIAVADAGLGEILAAIERNSLVDDTVVIFTTDHGAPFPRAKSTLYDPGVRVAFMVRLPSTLREAEPRLVSDLMSHVDVVPTLLELASIAVPENIQGMSLAGTWTHGAPTDRREVYLEKTYHADYDPIRAVRTESHKYIRNFEPRPLLDLPPDLEDSLTRRGMGDDHLAPRPSEELYDLRTDPLERANLAADPEHAATLRELRERLTAFMVATGDRLLDGPVPAPGAGRDTA